jgi:hypothetical protein
MKRCVIGIHHPDAQNHSPFCNALKNLQGETATEGTAPGWIDIKSRLADFGRVGLIAVVHDPFPQQIPYKSALGLKGEDHFRKAYLKPALAAQVIEMTQPDKPNSRSQRYRLTIIGRQWLKAHPGGDLA